jgi:Tfp pilus assembly protein PilF
MQAFTYHNLSVCLWKKNQKNAAWVIVKKAIARQPQEPLIQQNLKIYQENDITIALLILPGRGAACQNYQKEY